ncbi:Reverse transcriptase domain-containing protein [Aphis craccivora]|uniref:Reverse transcriptase domain-containing protein n=1 Tax=Aphis craccivora TaxID=307492 RepID=A0A6G0Y4A7_APHCR|nr:Reverse transcriptase domain-containing protein [Aphis craccivora]
MHNEIKNRLSSANKYYFSLLKLLKSKYLSYESKKILYTSYIRPILTYGCDYVRHGQSPRETTRA